MAGLEVEKRAEEEEEEEIPELEDMTEQLQKVKLIPEPSKVSSNSQQAEDYTKTVDEIQQSGLREREELDRKLAQSLLKSAPSPSQPGKIVEGKPASKQNPLEFKEVQENMQKGSLNAYVEKTKSQWMTPDLLQAVQKNPSLMQNLADPEINQAILMMQTKPEEAKKKYEKNEKVTKFMVEFSKLMGSHFETLAKTEEAKKPQEAEQPLMKETSSKVITPTGSKPATKPATTTQAKATSSPISTTDPALAKKLEDPSVKAIMSDKRVLAFLEHLQKGNPVDFFQLARADPELAFKLRVLIEKGILNTHAQPPK